MAEKKAVTEKSKKPPFFKRIGSWLKKFFKDYKSELQKIVWPSKEETLKKSWVVIVSLVVSSAVIGGVDYAFGQLVLWLGTLVA
ncbi:MAG TPA: preprotein translocase subunit SecE [Bacillota bacterium]|nr:preprotein translocase subunit SecE [Bacillota bacterium]